MAKIKQLIQKMKENPRDVRFSDLCKICEYHFGKPRHTASSHHVYKTPWLGDPRVNIQNRKGKAKAYQVKQVLYAIERLNDKNATKE